MEGGYELISYNQVRPEDLYDMLSQEDLHWVSLSQVSDYYPKSPSI